MFFFKLIVFIFNLFEFILELLYLFLLLVIDILQRVEFFFVFIVLYPTDFYIDHTPEEASICYILFSSVILQKLEILQISCAHVVSDHASLFLEVKAVDLFLVGEAFV